MRDNTFFVTRDLVHRGWSDFEPKLVAAIAGGGGAAVLAAVARAYGIDLPNEVIEYAPLLVAALIGWATPSPGTIVSNPSTPNVVEQHVGPAVTTFTAPTAVQAPRRGERVDGDSNNTSPSFTDIVENTPRARDEQPTQIIPGTVFPDLARESAAARFLTARGTNETGPQSIDGH